MTNDGIPPMKPLAPIVDHLREIAAEELPSPQTCEVTLWDDGTFEATIFHSGDGDYREDIWYERTTSEILWLCADGSGMERTEFTAGEVLLEPVVDETDIRVITTVEPPYR